MTQRFGQVEPPGPREAIGQAIQEITAARLGRGFFPLAALAIAGVVELALVGVAAPRGWILVGGAALTAVTMLAYALRNVQLTFGRPPKGWMTLAVVGSLVPPAFTVYVLAWRGLRAVALGDGFSPRTVGVVMVALGLWALRSWMKVVEVQHLARAMMVGDDLDERRYP